MFSSLELRKSNILSKHWMFCIGNCAGSAVVIASLLTSFHAFHFGNYKDKEKCVSKQKQKSYNFRRETAIDLDFFFFVIWMDNIVVSLTLS